MARDYVFAGRAFYDFFSLPGPSTFYVFRHAMWCTLGAVSAFEFSSPEERSPGKKFNWSSFNGDG